MNRCRCLLCSSLIVIATAMAQINSELHRPLSCAKIGLKGAVHTIKLEQRIVTTFNDRVIEDLRWNMEEAVFDPQGRMIEFKDYPVRGILRRWSRYEYNDQSLQRSVSEFYDKDGKLYRQSQYEYDEKVGIKQQINLDYDDDGKMFRRTVLTRTPPGAVDIKEYKAEGTLIKRNFIGNKFMQSGRAIKKEPDSPTSAQEQKKILPVRNQGSYDEVDAQGNWVKMSSPTEVRVSNGQRLKIQESFIRTITYY